MLLIYQLVIIASGEGNIMIRHLSRVIRRRVGPVAGAGAAQAAACSGAVAAGTTCTDTGTLTFSAGTLTLTSPTALAWAGADTGLNQLLVDTTTAQQSYIVDDATGSGAGWNVTVSATTFTSTTPVATLPNTGAFATNGSLTLTGGALTTTAPTAACTGTNTCTLPSNVLAGSYPIIMNTLVSSPTVYKIYDDSATFGLGSITIGLPGANAVGWWVAVPANAVPSTSGYTSTVTLEVVSGP
jgi:hypothetical protein